MIKRTQTNVSPGNCWQTAIACILDVEPETLPDQVSIEAVEPRAYWNALQAYLATHHGLIYTELPMWQCAVLMVRDPGWHLLCGPTVRTRETGVQHVIVGRYGEFVWDPHPSRAGLVEVQRWGILSPLTQEMKDHRAAWKDAPKCACPACLRAVAADVPKVRRDVDLDLATVIP